MKVQFFLKAFTTIVLLSIISFIGYGQHSIGMVSNGFHLGVFGEGNVAQKMTTVTVSGETPAPESHATMGWKTGVEISYHFANYFGASIGVAYGTVAQYRYDIFTSSNNLGIQDNRFGLGTPMRLNRLQIPVKFEFHVPFTDNWALYSSIGVNLQNLPQAIGFAWEKNKRGYVDSYLLNKYNDSHNIVWSVPEGVAYKARIADDYGHTIRTDLMFDVGVYYRLPYADLLRIAIVGNVALSEKLIGKFEYVFDNTMGTLSYSHNYVGMEVAYIHCFKIKEQRTKRKNENITKDRW